MFKHFISYMFLASFLVSTPLLAQQTLPNWQVWSPDQPEILSLKIPTDMQAPLPEFHERRGYVVLELEPSWQPEWKKAAFDLKGLIVATRSLGKDVKVGVFASTEQIDALLRQEMAAYFDGYLFEEDPFLPEADETGKLWQRTKIAPYELIPTLVDAASMGIETVFFKDLTLSQSQMAMVKTLSNINTGSLDLQPTVRGIDQDRVTFFFDPSSGNYHLAVAAEKGSEQEVTFELAADTKVSAIYPEAGNYRHRQYGKRTQILMRGDSDAWLFLVEPGEKTGTSETLEIVSQKIVDPYELVVKNQVFKKRQEPLLETLEVDEELNYRYQAAGGIDIDVTFMDTVILIPEKPIERVRRETYIAGVRWDSENQPELPLISPEKVQTAPLVIDLDKSYTYKYMGEGSVAGFPCWKVAFQPKSDGNFFSGTVWIDKETGAHRKLRATQSGLEPPVIGNEMTVFFDWVEQDGKRFWTQVQEKNLQLVNIVGERITLLIDSTRSNWRFNSGNAKENLEKAYASNLPILRDTNDGFRYLLKKANGQRELADELFPAKKAILGGILYDPALDTPIPLAGFNYTDLDFLDRGYQANFFLAGAINDLIVSNPDFLGRGLDLTAELFLTPLYFEDSIYDGTEEVEDLTIETLRESFNLTLGVPMGTFFKVSGNYSATYLDFKEIDETREDYVIPVSTIEHGTQIALEYSRSRFVSELSYETVSRSDWEDFGLETDSDPVQDSYRKLRFDASVSKRLPKFQTLGAEFRYLKGWDLDRFSRFSFGTFGNSVSGFGTSGVRADEAYMLEFEYAIGVKGLFNIDVSLDTARAINNEEVLIGDILQAEEVDMAGIGVAANFLGPWRTLIRFNVGYGFYSTLDEIEGDMTGQLVFLKLF